MPEIKQNFTRGKMNKDLDERLIPKGEYREAQNIHISESEGSDVGAIENILSNQQLTSAFSGLGTNTSGEGYEVIGYCKDLANKRVVYFISNFSNTSFTDDIRHIDRALNVGTTDYVFSAGHDSAIILYDVENNTQNILVKGPWLNLSKNHLITGVAIVEDLLFWTDNLNQPRKINIQTALEEGPDYYDCEENISVAKYAPYKAIMLHDDSASSSSLPSVQSGIESDYMKERFIRFSYRYKYDDGEYSLIAPFTQAVFEPLNEGEITNSADDDERNETSNEPNVLTGKKEVYKKGIVDIMQNRINSVDLRIPLPNKDEFSNVPSAGSYNNDYNIKEIEILLKESDGISFKLVKSIKVDEIESSDIVVYTHKSTSDTTLYNRHAFKYTYKSSEPYQVLPESQVNRVYDQVPLMAKTLEVVGNRVVFGNYVENYDYPTDINNKKGINYRVKETVKGAIDQASAISPAAEPYFYGLKQFMHKTYKYHTLKQRRTYQVGIVFSDAFGRQSPVILSSNVDFDNPDTITILPEIQNYGTNTNAVWNTTHDSYGKSLSIEFQDNNLTNDDKFAASLPFGINSQYQKRLVYNPHGWYSYRIVVKQQEQEYYNVYAPHTFDGWDNIEEKPNNSLTGGRSWLFLHGDNVNKVPRSLNDTDLNRDGTMGSNVRLYPKVIFDSRDGLKLGAVSDIGVFITDSVSGITDGSYTINITDTGVTTSGDGDGAQITVTILSGVVDAISVIKSGSGFKEDDTITITSAPFDTDTLELTLRSTDVYNSPGESRQNNSYHELAEVISLGTAFEQNLYISGDDNKSGTGGFSIYNFIYGKNKNPLVAEMQNMRAYTGNTSNNKALVLYAGDAHNSNSEQRHFREDQLTSTDYDIDSEYDLTGWSLNTAIISGQEELTINSVNTSNDYASLSSAQTISEYDKIVLSNYYEGLSIFETEPFVSKLDIYYETSTSGLVSDLLEEIVTNSEDSPTGLTIKQDTGYDFGTGQPAVSTSHQQYGSIAYLYENTEADDYIGDLDATQSQTSIDAGATKDLSFSIQKATRVGDQANITNSLAIEEVSGVHKVKVVGAFVYRGNNNDDIELLVEVNDNNSGGVAFLSVTIQVTNSKPTISSLPASIDIQKDAGSDSDVVVSSNNFTNGGLVTGGAFNKYSDVDIDHSFPGTNLRDLITGQLINFENYFVTNKTSVEGVYEVKTKSEWNILNATRFFEQSAADRTMTITATDSGGLTTTTSTVINEDDIVTVRGLVYEYAFSDVTEDNALTTATDQSGDRAVYYAWATTGTGLDPVNPYDDGHFLQNSGYLQLSAGNKLFSKSDLSSTLSAGKYLTIREIVQFGSRYEVDVIQVSASGVVSILGTFTVLRFPK